MSMETMEKSSPPITPSSNEQEKGKVALEKTQQRQKLRTDCQQAVTELEQLNSNPQVQEQYGNSFTILYEEFTKFNTLYEDYKKDIKEHPEHARRMDLIGLNEEQEQSLSQLLGIYKKFQEGVRSGNVTTAQRELGLYRGQKRKEQARIEAQQREQQKRQLVESIKTDRGQIEQIMTRIEDNERILEGLEQFEKAA